MAQFDVIAAEAATSDQGPGSRELIVGDRELDVAVAAVALNSLTVDGFDAGRGS